MTLAILFLTVELNLTAMFMIPINMVAVDYKTAFKTATVLWQDLGLVLS